MILAIHDQNVTLKGFTYEVAAGVFVEIDSGTLEDAQNEYTKYLLSLQPTPLDQIRALEAANSDSVARVTRQALLMQTVALALDKPEAQILTAEMSEEDAKNTIIQILLASDPGFKLMYELEQSIEPLRAQIE